MAAVTAPLLAQGQGQQGPLPRLYVSGDSNSLSLVTPWKRQEIRWTVRGQTGTLANGQTVSDAQGCLRLAVGWPDVRVPSPMSLAVSAGDQDNAAKTYEIVVLPKDPLGDLTALSAKMPLGVLGEGPLGAAARQGGLKPVELDHDVARGLFRGRTVLLCGLLGDDEAATKVWLESLPAGTCVVLADDANGRKHPAEALGLLAGTGTPREACLYVDGNSILWAGCQPRWLGPQSPGCRLAELRNVASLRILAAFFDRGGCCMPLAFETRDLAQRRFLVWNPGEPISPGDARWPWILRSSLLWAAEQHSALREAASKEGHS